MKTRVPKPSLLYCFTCAQANLNSGTAEPHWRGALFWHRLDKGLFWKQTGLPDNSFSYALPVLGPDLTSAVGTVWFISSSTKTRRGTIFALPPSSTPSTHSRVHCRGKGCGWLPVCVQSIPQPERQMTLGD